MAPINLLSDKSKFVRFKDVSQAGMEPVISLSFNLKDWRFVKALKDSGMVPTKELWSNHRIVSADKLLRASGILPVKFKLESFTAVILGDGSVVHLVQSYGV
jgi:hypothetical protein